MNDAHQLAPLLLRCRAGDSAALNGLLEKLRPYVRLLLRSRITPELGRRLDASDLVQETLLRISRGFGRFAGESVPQLLAWVGRIASHVLASSARHHGAGLGLSMVKSLVELHGGSVSLNSAPGRGTCIRASAPARSAPKDGDADRSPVPDDADKAVADAGRGAGGT